MVVVYWTKAVVLGSGAHPARLPDQNLGYLKAQLAANATGVRELQRLVEQHGLDVVHSSSAEQRVVLSGRIGSLAAAFPVKLPLQELTETALLSEAGLPNRPWFRHVIYAPGELTGYAAVVIPGVNEALDAKDRKLAAQQLAVLTAALMRAAQALESAR